MNARIYLVGSRMALARGYESKYIYPLSLWPDTRFDESIEKNRFIVAV